MRYARLYAPTLSLKCVFIYMYRITIKFLEYLLTKSMDKIVHVKVASLCQGSPDENKNQNQI